MEVWIAEKEDDAREMATFNALFFGCFSAYLFGCNLIGYDDADAGVGVILQYVTL